MEWKELLNVFVRGSFSFAEISVCDIINIFGQ